MKSDLFSNIPQYCDQAIRAMLLAFAFTVPFVFDLRLYSTFDLCKLTWMYLFSLIILALWLLRALFSNQTKLLTTGFDWPILAYLFINILTTLTSVSPTISLFGFYKRYEGLLAITNYIFLCYVVVNVMNSLPLVYRLMKTVILAATLVSVYGISQHLGYDPFKWSFSMRERVFATFGNPVFLSAYLMMVFPFSLVVYLFKEEKSNPRKQPSKSGGFLSTSAKIAWRGFWKFFWAAGISPILIFVCFLCTNSRGPFAGFIVAMTILVICIGKKRLLEKKSKLYLVAGVIIPMFIIFNLNPETSVLTRIFGTLFKPVTQTQEQSTKESSKLIEENLQKSICSSGLKFTAGMGEERVQLWKGTLGVIKRYPVLGIGPDTLQLMNVGTDKAHNDFLDVAVTRGLIGLAIYLWLIVWYIRKASQSISQAKGEKKYVLLSLLVCVIGYLIQNQVSFGLDCILSLFWMTLGMTAAVTMPEIKTKVKAEPAIRNPFLLYAVLSLIIISTGLLFYLALQPYKADIYYRQGFDFVERHEYEAGIPGMEKAVEIFPYENCYWKVLNSVYVERANSDPQNRQKWVEKALKGTDWLLKLIPKDEGCHFNRGMVYYLTHQTEKAIEAYNQVLSLTNNKHIDSLNNLGTIYANQGKYTQAAELFKQVLNLAPTHQSAKENLRKVYLIQNQPEEANKLNSSQDDLSSHIKMASLYYQKGNLDKVVEELKEVIKLAPRHLESYRNIASIYYQQGKYQQAKIWFEKVLELEPGNSYAKRMMDILRQRERGGV